MDYFSWLCNLISSDDTYIDLLIELDNMDYIWHLVLDENRAKGGLQLRERFAKEAGVFSSDVRTGSCTVLEMLIALSELMSEQIDGSETYECFWMIINNLNLRNVHHTRIREIINNFLTNNYSNKFGGLFPLRNYYGDIRGLDLYSQMNAWLEENFPHQNIF